MHNLLVVSDVHLSHLRPKMMIGGQRELARFIEHFAAHRVEGRPWRLLLNGDLFDFDHHASSIEERGPEEESLRLFEEIADEYPEVFEALGRFADQGHEIVVLPGNHDLDLVWPGVQQAFRQRLADSARDPQAPSRLFFRDWFYFEPGRVWVEHGQQYDPDTSTPGLLDPFDAGPAGTGPRLRRNLGTHWIADFCPHIPEIAYHVDHTRGPLFYLPVVLRQYGPRGPWLWSRYASFAIRTTLAAGQQGKVPSARHAARRRQLAAEHGLDDELLRGFEAWVPSRFASRLQTAARLHLLAALLLPVVLGLGAGAAALGSLPLLVAALALTAVMLGVSLSVSGRYQGRVESLLREQARRTQAALGVPLVLLGHDHIAADEPVGHGRYLNSGTWVSPHLPFSYVQVIGHRATLCRWEPGEDPA